ncbi:MAG: molybdopterin cofactor-binding domain-containing protein [Gammaproteobacteria bacterium]|nr:molybdopterin cofactor-binding domain-containing protein [Gammaproteobacteria bacterium]
MSDTTSLAANPMVDDWIAIEANERVIVRTGKVDIGQRISTALAAIAADELGVALERVHVEAPRTGRAPDEGYTSGSNSMQDSGGALRLAAATAREHMLALAAETLGVEAASLECSDGLIRSREINRSITCWELMGGKPFGVAVDRSARVRAAAEYHYIGRRAPARGLSGLVTGATRFVQDVTMPGMLHARVVRPPHYHARLEQLDETVVGDGDEVRLVRDGSFVAVAAADEHRAVRAAARGAAAAHWSTASGLEPQVVHARLTANRRVSLPVHEGVPRQEPVPEPAAPPAQAALTLEARYERPYQMHGSLGPSAALALWRDDKLRIWTHSQGIYPLRESLAESLGLAPAALELEHVAGPGCYGHNGADDAALDAALVARALPATPILLKWSREDEHAWEPYGPAMVMCLRASLDAQGRVVHWSHETFSDTHRGRPRPGPGGAGPSRLLATHHLGTPRAPLEAEPNMGYHGGIHRNADPLYAFPARRIVKHLVRGMPLRTSAMRTLGGYANVFALESFMDELAHAAGVDPLEFRLRHLDDPRARTVLERAAARFGWGGKASGDGRGHGLGFARYTNSKTYAAVIVELDVDDAARVKLRRVVVAADAGEVVDPDGLEAQLEGGVIQAASWTLYEEVGFDASGITSRDWESYPILRFDDVPDIETVLIDRPGEGFLGAGEASCVPVAAAIANAIHDATGLRLRRIPFTPDAIRAAALAGTA